jgi:multidrug resistance protein MdtO
MMSLTQPAEKPGLLAWLPHFFRQELAPYPGRWSLVTRMVIAATLSMLIIVTFRIPYGAIGVNCAFILSRENLLSTARSGFYFILAFAAWAVAIPIGARMFASIPITHFLWEGTTIFLCFFFLRTLTNFVLATGVVVVATATTTIWYLPGPAELNVELTLWQILATTIGALTTFLVEVVFHYYSKTDPILNGIDARLRIIEDMLSNYDGRIAPFPATVRTITQYAVVGTGTLRQQIARGNYAALERTRLSALVSLLGQSIDISAALVSGYHEQESVSRERAKNLRLRLGSIRNAIRTADSHLDSPHSTTTAGRPPLFSELEATVGLMESVLDCRKAVDPSLTPLEDVATTNRVFVSDAFVNPDHLKFALAGTAAAMLCYVIYVGLNWPGISTAVTTCALTALSNIGSSRQKQTLRIGGAAIGGLVFGLGSQIFVLPYIDSIVGLTVLFAVVTGISAYVATSSPRLSYAGLQMAFAFYLINVTDFSISMDLTIGRDRVVGVLLGIASMWIVFERLRPRPASVEMVRMFAESARLIATVGAGSWSESEVDHMSRVRQEVYSLFTNVNAEADAVLFESGRHRISRLAARNRVRRWLSKLRTIYLLELPFIQFRLTGERNQMSPALREMELRLFAMVSTSLGRIAERLESEVIGTSDRYPGSERALTTPPLQKGPQELASEEPLAKLAKLVVQLADELEADVSKEPVFAP